MTANAGLWPRPTREEVAAAAGRAIPDVLAPGLAVLFCGINPSLYSGATGHHFSRPGNRFWRVLHQAGFTDRVLSPFEDGLLPTRGIGITNLVRRSTRGADELRADELRVGAERVRRLACRLRPRVVAFVGMGAYRTAFERPGAGVGPQQGHSLCRSRVWVLPNPSGLNAHYQVPELVAAFSELRAAAFDPVSDPSPRPA